MRCQELGWTKARTEAAQSRNAFAAIVDDGYPRAEVRQVAVDCLSRSKFADVADRALARRHEQAARAMQVIPLRLVFAVAVEHLHAMVLAIGDIEPAIGIARDIVCECKL